MRFDLGSFLLGCGVGAATVVVGRHLRPALVEAATAGYQIIDGIAARIAIVQEDFEDVLAEAKARARGAQPEPQRESA
ncbi:MAG: hypothetical protein QNK03_06360 [Myxococcota bacterium]|nr:hypothetical protein [Myxococcota bacterium]